MVSVSNLLVPDTDKVTVTVSLATAMLAAVMSRLLAKDTLPALVLNCQPNGSVRTNVLLFPAPKSVVAASARTMFPRAVNPAPLIEFTDLSAEISLPPTGSVMMTSASSWAECRTMKPKTRVS